MVHRILALCMLQLHVQTGEYCCNISSRWKLEFHWIQPVATIYTYTMLVLVPQVILAMNSLYSKSEYSFRPNSNDTCPNSYNLLCWAISSLFFRKILLRRRSSSLFWYTLPCCCWNSHFTGLIAFVGLIDFYTLNNCHSSLRTLSPTASSKTVRPLTKIIDTSNTKELSLCILV